jgi:hypothetical protein
MAAWLRNRPSGSVRLGRFPKRPNNNNSELAKEPSHVIPSPIPSPPEPAVTTSSWTSYNYIPSSEVSDVATGASAHLNEHHPAYYLFARNQLAVVRQLEMMNVLMGFEQANRYAIKNEEGHDVGYIVEEDSFGLSLFRNFLHSHRKMNAMILDTQGKVLLKVLSVF